MEASDRVWIAPGLFAYLWQMLTGARTEAPVQLVLVQGGLSEAEPRADELGLAA